jgi:hypothetical protein
VSDTITITDSESVIRFADGGATRDVHLLEIGPAGARIAAGAALAKGAYVDCELRLKGLRPHALFAHVVEIGAAGITLRWMFLEPGQEEAVRGAVDILRGGQVPAQSGTRRVIRPSASRLPPVPTEPAPAAPAAAAGDGDRVGTRRVLRPSSQRLQPVAHAPSDAAPADEAPAPSPGAAPAAPAQPPVVIASTDRFTKLKEAATPAAEPESPVPPQPAPAKVLGADGRMDVGAAIRNRAKTVSASELAARHEKVRVLNMGTIKALIQEAVQEAAGHLTRSLGEAERERLLKEAEEGFQERMKAFEAQKLSAEARSAQLQEQLRKAQETLEQERQRAIKADQFTVSAAGLEALDDQIRRSLDRTIAGKEVHPDLEQQLRTLVAHVLDSEREKMRAKEQEAQNAAIALLEKKISRLSDSLSDAERQRDEARQFAAMVESQGGGAVSLQKFQAGLKGDDPNKKRKMELMKELMEENRKLRRELGIATNTAPMPAPAADEPATAPAATQVPEPEPVAPAPVAAATDDPAAPDDDAPAGEPEVNPDDLPWEPSAAPAAAPEDDDDRGIKRIRVTTLREPPPLASAAAPTDDPPADDAPVEIDPDDLPWEPPAAAASGPVIRTPGS